MLTAVSNDCVSVTHINAETVQNILLKFKNSSKVISCCDPRLFHFEAHVSETCPACFRCHSWFRQKARWQASPQLHRNRFRCTKQADVKNMQDRYPLWLCSRNVHTGTDIEAAFMPNLIFRFRGMLNELHCVTEFSVPLQCRPVLPVGLKDRSILLLCHRFADMTLMRQ